MNTYDLTKAAKDLKQGRLQAVLEYLLHQHAKEKGLKLVPCGYDDEYRAEEIPSVLEDDQ